MKTYMRLLIYPAVAPLVVMPLWITLIFGHGCLTGDRCWLPEMYYPVFLFGILGIGYLFGVMPAVVGGLIVAILESKWSIRSRWLIFVLGCLAALSTVVWTLSPSGLANMQADRKTIVGLLLFAGFLVSGGVAALTAEWVHRRFVVGRKTKGVPS